MLGVNANPAGRDQIEQDVDAFLPAELVGTRLGSTRIFDLEPAITAYPEQLSREIWQNPPSVLDLT